MWGTSPAGDVPFSTDVDDYVDVNTDAYSETEAEDDFEQSFYKRYFEKDQRCLSSYDYDVLYNPSICHDHHPNLRHMETRYRKKSKDCRNHGLSKHREAKTDRRVKKRLAIITSNPNRPQNEARVCVQVPKHLAKRIIHKQERAQLHQSISHIHSLSDVHIIEKTQLDEDPQRIRIEYDDYEETCPVCGGSGYDSDSDYESYSDDGYDSDCGRYGRWSRRRRYYTGECRCCNGYGSISVSCEREIILPPPEDKVKQYPYCGKRSREHSHQKL